MQTATETKRMNFDLRATKDREWAGDLRFAEIRVLEEVVRKRQADSNAPALLLERLVQRSTSASALDREALLGLDDAWGVDQT
ncbi:MAG TPA: hypothetical protein VFW80_06975 [Gaiellaceae bacterium]|nr:hypothetical protein [Gaiellaceae bacterium]